MAILDMGSGHGRPRRKAVVGEVIGEVDHIRPIDIHRVDLKIADPIRLES